MSQLHQVVYEIIQNPSRVKDLLASLGSAPSAKLTAEEQYALQAVLQNGTLAMPFDGHDYINEKAAHLVELWVRPTD
ncbi:MAG: hypothetical protein H6652_18165 [Ardenticatenaceae bacterium]|nr:hypothetical protein [Ardenticatenaceae bacterium]MCB8948348.1 hypothetical protein [Ardenticatenaceae bacterium]